MHFRHTLLLTGLLASAFAHAGNLSGSAWSPVGCGPRPAAPALDLKNPDAFNNSLAPVNVYRRDINAYLNCVVQEANRDILAVNTFALEAQRAARDANDKIQADVKAADAKFGK